jgi:hypothetical protein
LTGVTRTFSIVAGLVGLSIVMGLTTRPAPQESGLVPTRILLTVTADPSSSATVTWRTEQLPTAAQGQIALASPDPRFVKTAVDVAAVTTPLNVGADRNAYYNTVRFTGLAPDTRYAYRVGGGKDWSEWVHFRTAKATPSEFSFIYFGDAQNDVKSLWSRVIRQAYSSAPNAAFILHAGDLIDEATIDEEWKDWFYAGGWVHASVPCLATPGNHEYDEVGDKKTLSTFWKPQYANPENGPAGLERSAYYIDYQGARIVSLNSNERIAEQAAWLDRVLAANPNRWAIVTFHHPIYSTALGRNNPEVRQQWQPILQKHNVALVLQGHDHTYGRTNVPTGATQQDPRSGTMYVVSVSGPKMYRLGPETAATMPRRAEYTQLYQIVHVSPQRIRFEAFTATGEPYDVFEITKNRNGTNRITEGKVKTAQRIEAKPATSRRDE